MHRAFVLAAALAIATTGCIAPQTSTAKLTESAYDMNVAARFGRLDVAVEHVAGDAQARFMSQRAEWGRRVRVVDVEFAGMRLLKAGEARVEVMVMWQKVDGLELRTTTIAQTWREKDGRWLVWKEETSGGDTGLLEDPIDPKKEPTKAAKLDRDADASPIGGMTAPGAPGDMSQALAPACELQPSACR